MPLVVRLPARVGVVYYTQRRSRVDDACKERVEKQKRGGEVADVLPPISTSENMNL